MMGYLKRYVPTPWAKLLRCGCCVWQVLGKRRKVVQDMCEQVAIKVRQQAQGKEWKLLLPDQGEGSPSSDGTVPAVEKFLKDALMPIAEKEPEVYNDNKPLGKAIEEAVALADLVNGWPAEVRALAEVAKVASGGEGAGEGEGHITAELLVRSEGSLALFLDMNDGTTVPIEVMQGISALLWARLPSAPLSLNLVKRKISAEGLAVLGRAMTPTLTSLNLGESDCANNGGNNTGIQQLRNGLERGGSGLTLLKLQSNQLNAGAARLVAEVLGFTAELTSLE